MPSHSFSARRPSGLLRHRAAGWCLLVMVLLAPWLGMVHAVVHAPALPGAVAQHLHAGQTAYAPDGSAHAFADAAQGPHGDGAWVQRLFGAHGAGDCRIYDQLSHAEALLSAAALVVPLAWAAPRFAAPAPLQPCCGGAFFDARAPPSTR